ncbi:hypothetical protein ACHWQZ_G010210 [Mnemiopsis leidyi]
MLKNLKIDSKQVPKQKTNDELIVAKSDDSEMKINQFENLPHELIGMIIGYIRDLRDRAQVARVCALFHKIVTDETAIKELNLKPFYTKITGDALINITACYSLAITKLDLSWTGFEHSSINSQSAIEGIKSLSNLEELRCRNCQSFVHDKFLSILAAHCPNLKLLDLFRCNNFSLSSLKPLKHLNYLDISQCSDVEYCTDLESEESFFKCCQQIKWFFMGRSSHHMFGSRSYGTVAELIIRDMIQNCKDIHGVNFWRQRGIGQIFPEFVKKFGPTLKYLDLEWTGLHQSPSNWDPKNFWSLLLGSCPQLEYLALTSVNMRMDDEDIANFAKYCPNLEQLDLLGVRGFSDTGLHSLLSGCKNMKFLDLSYGKTSVDTVAQLQEMYPHCDIKHVPTILNANKVVRRNRGLDPDELETEVEPIQ